MAALLEPQRQGALLPRRGTCTLPPAARISATVFLPRSTLRPTTMTWIPRAASLLATARPMPLVPPVINAVDEFVLIYNLSSV